MKKILYLALFVLCTLLLVGCDDETKGRTFDLLLNDYTELREKIVFEVTLKDPDKQLKKSDVKGVITKKGSKTILSTKTLSFDSNNYDEVSFTGLTAYSDYSVEFYTSFNGKKVSLLTGDYKTTNEGTIKNPYKIGSVDDFKKVRQERAGHFKLVGDINFEGKNISPLFQSAFTGTFDGSKEDGSGNYKIYNFTFGKIVDEKAEVKTYTHVASRDQYYGFFGNIGEGAKISNLELSGINIYVSRDTNRNSGTYANSIYYYGILAGVCAGTIENVKVTEYKNENNEIIRSSLNVKSENTNLQVLKVGGLVGNLKDNGVIKNVEVDVDINVESSKDVSVGGIAGTTRGAALLKETVEGVTKDIPNISNATYTGSINVSINGNDSYKGSGDDKEIAQPSIGGLVGKNVEAVVQDCSADAAIKVTSKFKENEGLSIFVGGLVGKNISDKSLFNNCAATVSFDVETYDVPKENTELNIYVGLFAGQNGGDLGGYSTISNCTFTVKGENVVKVIYIENDSNVHCHFDKVGKAMVGSELTNSTLVEGTASISLTVSQYTKAEGSEEYTEVTAASETKSIER